MSDRDINRLIQAVDDLLRFLKMLPKDITVPEILEEPDGSVALEWYRWTRYTFVVSFSGSGNISYAGLYGTDSAHGTERLGAVIQPRILQHLAELYTADINND